MEISAAQVKELREKTGVGLMDCKKALADANGDIETAIKALREKGLARAAKKADRTTNEGKVFIVSSQNQNVVVVLEVNCETDFVANNTDFAAFGNDVANILLNDASITTIEALETSTTQGKNFKDMYSEYVIKLGENIKVKRFERLVGEAPIATYTHSNGKIGTAVVFSNTVDLAIGKDIAMQVAASNPTYTRPEEVPQTDIENERGILKTQVLNEGKPAAIVDKIVEGKLSKFFKDICLLEQAYLKDDKKAVKDILPKDTTIVKFTRFELA